MCSWGGCNWGGNWAIVLSAYTHVVEEMCTRSEVCVVERVSDRRRKYVLIGCVR